MIMICTQHVTDNFDINDPNKNRAITVNEVVSPVYFDLNLEIISI